MPTARNKPSAIVLDMLRSARSRHRTSQSLVNAGALFGFSENTMRVTLSRLMSRGLIESPKRGVYKLSSQTDALNEFVEAWRLGESRVREWTYGQWLFAHLPGNLAQSDWALDALGFREIRPALWARPDNLAMNLKDLRILAASIGLADTVLLLTGTPDRDSEQKDWLQHWRPEDLNATYSDALQRIEASVRRLPALPLSEAKLECFSLGGEMIHHLAKDPLLPPPLVNTNARKALWRAMLAYDTHGKDIWAAGKADELHVMPRPQLAVAT